MFKSFSFNFILLFSFCYKHLYYKIIEKFINLSIFSLRLFIINVKINTGISIHIFAIHVNKILNNEYNISDLSYPNTYSKIYDTSDKWKTPVSINLSKVSKLFKSVSNL